MDDAYSPPVLAMDDAVSTSSSPAPPPPPPHIIICPWLAFGHMLPYHELADRLASRGHRVSYVSTPRNLARLPSRRHAGVDHVPLQLPRVDGLPDGTEATNDVPGDKLASLWDAFDGLAAPLAEFLAAACAAGDDDWRRPDWILVDTFHHWASARRRRVARGAVRHAPAQRGLHRGVVGHGMVTTSWAPHNTILAHGAVGAFLTHCGRNSLTEGLQYWHPLIMLPIFADQGPNARLMAERKVGLQVPRDEDDGSFDRQGIGDTVRAVMVDEDSRKVFVANAMKLQEVVADEKLQEGYLDEFVQRLRSYTPS